MKRNIFDKVKLIMIVVTGIMLGACFFLNGVGEVQAETTSVEFDKETYDYAYATFTGDAVGTVKDCLDKNTAPTIDEADRYLFAGWFKKDSCTLEDAITSSDEIKADGTYYAKFVSEDVLSVRAQISNIAEEDIDENTTFNMRFVSSVDSLAYNKVGFKLVYKENNKEVTKYNNSKKVFDRIQSASAYDEYKYSSKVVDAESEYFITATWKNISDYNQYFYVQAYWKTLDGVVIYGPGRYVCVNDGLDKNIVNVAVKGLTTTSGSVSVSGGTHNPTGTIAWHDGTYAHVKINLGEGVNKKTALKSVTKFDVGGQTVYYRNLYTEYNGTAESIDKSWYEAYSNTEEDKFVIATDADLWGFAELSQTNNFQGDTVIAVANIEINKGRVVDGQWGADADGKITSYPWTTIGSSSKKFNGNFDGDGNTISGLCMQTPQDYAGMFGSVGATNGSVQNVYVDETVYVKNNSKAVKNTGTTGGVVGYIDVSEEKYISGCWFAGTIYTTYARCGGIVGRVYQGTVNVENCLFTGNIQSTASAAKAGGIAGDGTDTNATLVVNNSLSAGEIQADNATSLVGTIVGGLKSSLRSEYTNVYSTSTVITNDDYVDETGNAGENGTAISDTTQILGYSAYFSEIAPIFENNDVWVARSNDIPAPKMFVCHADSMECDFDWYYTPQIAGEYVINTKEDLYGFMALVNSKTDVFKNKTVKLGRDIEINEGSASEWEQGNGTTLLRSWLPIGTATTGQMFMGTFDGQGHTISGLYFRDSKDSVGFFGAIGASGRVCDLRLENGYFYQTEQGENARFIGSVAAYCQGDIDKVYSNMIIRTDGGTKDGYAGGIVAKAISQTGTFLNISNCWFDGEIVMGENSGIGGGIIGHVQRQASISNILFTGKINSKKDNTIRIGGFVGQIEAGATLEVDSGINAGTIIDACNENGVGAIAGRITNVISNNTAQSSTLEINNVFASRDCCSHSVGIIKGNAKGTDTDGNAIVATSTVTDTPVWTKSTDRLIGYCAEDSGEYLDFTGNADSSWVVRIDGVPVPCAFSDMVTTLDTQTLNQQLGLDWLSEILEKELELSTAIDKGVGNYVLTTQINEANYEQYLSYLQTGQLGFEVYVNNSEFTENAKSTAADGVYNVICIKKDGDWVLSITYVKNTSTMDISISTAGVESLSPHLKYSGVSGATDDWTYKKEKIKVHMPQIKNTENELEPGSCFVFELPNGHFIINDGGHSYNLADLITYLQSIVSAREDKKICVDAWIISHLHVDHSGIFIELNESYSELISVEAIYLSEPNKQTLKLESSLQGQIEDEYMGMAKLKKADGRSATDIYRFQTGQRYFFSGMIMNVIQTQDQLSLNATTKQYDAISYSNNYDEGQFNTTSTTLLYTMNDEEALYIGGDANLANDTYITSAYGDTSQLLKDIDIFVAPHHGLNLHQQFFNYLRQSGKFDVVVFPAAKVYSSKTGTTVANDDFNKKFTQYWNYYTYTKKVSHYGNGPVVLTQGSDF